MFWKVTSIPFLRRLVVKEKLCLFCFKTVYVLCVAIWYEVGLSPFLFFLCRDARQNYALGFMEGQKRRLGTADEENPKKRLDIRVKEKGKEPVKERLSPEEADELLRGTTTFPTKTREEALDLDSLIDEED